MEQRMPEKHPVGARPLWQRLAWLVTRWCADGLAVGGLAWVLRKFMAAAGLTTPSEKSWICHQDWSQWHGPCSTQGEELKPLMRIPLWMTIWTSYWNCAPPSR